MVDAADAAEVAGGVALSPSIARGRPIERGGGIARGWSGDWPSRAMFPG
jgi:hypothetical protein